MEQLNLACEKVISVEATSAEAAIRSNGELARLHKKCNLSPQSTATAKNEVTVLHKTLVGVTFEVNDLESKNTIVRKEIDTSLKTYAAVKAGLANDVDETGDNS